MANHALRRAYLIAPVAVQNQENERSENRLRSEPGPGRRRRTLFAGEETTVLADPEDP